MGMAWLAKALGDCDSMLNIWHEPVSRGNGWMFLGAGIAGPQSSDPSLVFICHDDIIRIGRMDMKNYTKICVLLFLPSMAITAYISRYMGGMTAHDFIFISLYTTSLLSFIYTVFLRRR
jgi:hypothetical protein